MERRPRREVGVHRHAYGCGANHLRERVLLCLKPERCQKLHDLSSFFLHQRVHHLLGGRRGRVRRQILKVAIRRLFSDGVKTSARVLDFEDLVGGRGRMKKELAVKRGDRTVTWSRTCNLSSVPFDRSRKKNTNNF